MKLAIPSYFYPDPEKDLWKRVLEVRPALVVINPASGPGEKPDANYMKLCRDLVARGIRALGYISTTWAKKEIWRADLERQDYRHFYPPVWQHGGFFYDEAATDGRCLFYYQALIRAGAGGMTSMVLNPGAFPDPAYLRIPAVKMIYETDYETYMTREPASWILAEPNPDHWWHCVFNVKNSAQMKRVVATAQRRKAGFVWITDDVGPNEYDSLPPYFEEMKAALA